MNRDLINTALKKRGHRIATATSGIEAIEQVGSGGPFDLILMDIQMPGMDGLETIRLIQSLGGSAATTPIFALTADVMPEQVTACLAAGMDGHIRKPIRLGELTKAIERSLSVARELKERHDINAQVDEAVHAFRVAYISDLLTVEAALKQTLMIQDKPNGWQQLPILHMPPLAQLECWASPSLQKLQRTLRFYSLRRKT